MTQIRNNHAKPDYKGAISQAANFICCHGFRVPALFVLESGSLLPYLGSQLLIVAQPALSLFMPSRKIRQVVEILEAPEAMSILTDYLREKDSGAL